MLNILFNFVFKIIMKIFDLITLPFFLAIYALFPQLSTYINYTTSFINSALTYVGVFTSSLLCPSGWWIALFSYLSIKLTIFLLARSFKFGINIYNKFKP